MPALARVFGQDWGGHIGLRLVAENPDRFAQVIIGNTALPNRPRPDLASIPRLAAVQPDDGCLRPRLARCHGSRDRSQPARSDLEPGIPQRPGNRPSPPGSATQIPSRAKPRQGPGASSGLLVRDLPNIEHPIIGGLAGTVKQTKQRECKLSRPNRRARKA